MGTAEESAVDAGRSPSELARLQEELRLCRLELVKSRVEQEELAEQQSSYRRAKQKAAKEADVLAKALADVLFRETRRQAMSGWWWPSRSRVSRREWAQVQTIRQSKYFRPAWYLRQNHDVARKGVDPALHFIRNGFREGRDPGPMFSVERYLKAHPRVAKAGENALIHAIENGTARDGVDGSAS